MKKGMVDLIIFIIIIIFTLGIILHYTLGETGLFKKATDKKLSDRFLPDVEDDEEIISGLVVPRDHVQAVKDLKSTIERMQKRGKDGCFSNYGYLPDLGEDGTTIELSYDARKQSTSFTLGVKGGKQIVVDAGFTIPKMVPCVIAGGKGKIAENFDDIFLNTLSWEEKMEKKKIKPNHFLPVNSIKISYETIGTLKKDGNHISVPQLGPDVVNDEGNNLLDGGYLYTPDGRHICFFPTVYGDVLGNCDGSSEEGLDDDCLQADYTEDISISNQMMEDKLGLC